MKQITIILLAALTFAACNKELSNKVNASSVDNELQPVQVIFDTSNMCYDGRSYHVAFTVINALPTDQISITFFSIAGELPTQSLESPTSDTTLYTATQETTIDAGVYFYVTWRREAQNYNFFSPEITDNCGGGLKKNILQKLKDKLNQMKP